MFYAGPATAPLVIVTDHRAKSDAELDARYPGSAPHVLDLWNTGRRAFGPGYKNIGRLALFDHGVEPSGAERSAARERLRETLVERGTRVAVVLPTSDQDDDGATQAARTVSWPAFDPPDGISAVRGCFCGGGDDGPYYIAVHPRIAQLKELQHWQQSKWLVNARAVADGRSRVLPAPLGYDMAALGRILSNRRPIAIDIEAIQDSDVIMCIGISDGIDSASIPWDAYIPHGHTKSYRGRTSSENAAVQFLLSGDRAKVFHNWTFDVAALRARGFTVNEPIEDTFAASAIAYPELRHGLQHACATHLLVPPWKSEWHPRLRGFTRDDPEHWTCDPEGLRAYNSKDAFYTWWLAATLLPKVGVKWS